MIRKAGWSPDWVEEYTEMMEEVIAASPDSAERRSAFLEKLHDAVQAHRTWALTLDSDVRRRGATDEVAWYAKARVPKRLFAHDGKLLTQDSVAGFRRTRRSGEKWVAQELITIAPWDELKAKRAEQITMERSYGAKAAMYDKLLALHDLVPGAANPEEAAAQLGISIDAYLAADGLAA